MAITNNTTILANGSAKGVGDPCPQYISLAPVYKRNRACLSGQRYVKDIDSVVSPLNLLIPFSPSMEQGQYDWYKQEAEFPGITEQYARTLVGGLLRKPPVISIDDDAEINQEQKEEALEWIRNDFNRNNSSIISFLDEALWEEMNTNRAWVCVNYPVTNPDNFTPEELQPYPILLSGESIINWATGVNKTSNKEELTRVVIRQFREEQSPTNTYHQEYLDTVWVHQLDEQGFYEIITFEVNKEASEDTQVIAGKIQQQYSGKGNSSNWVETDRETSILRNGERLDYIPIFPLNGSVEPTDPMLSNFINREVGLYNTISRRNHLLYGSASYTPVIFGEQLTDEDKDDIVSAGLGSWMFLGANDKAQILAAPTDALGDLDRSIESRIEEMARMGIRILSPEGTGESGIALEIRNSAQTAQLAALNHRISQQMTLIITTMINWRYNLELNPNQVVFTLSSDFNPAPLGESFLRLVTEWYEGGLISKEIWMNIAQANDVLPPDYNPDEDEEQIESDPMVITNREKFDAASTSTTK